MGQNTQHCSLNPGKGKRSQILPSFGYQAAILYGSVNLANEAGKGESLKSPLKEAARGWGERVRGGVRMPAMSAGYLRQHKKKEERRW